jgi:hypothetical protein
MKFRFAFDGEIGMEVVTIDTEVDYGPVSKTAFEFIDSVRPTNEEILIRAGEGAPVHLSIDAKEYGVEIWNDETVIL